MLRWIRKQRNLTLFYFILARHHGTLAKRRNVTTSLKNGTMNSKHQVSREIFFLIYSINDLSDIKPSYMKEDHGSRVLDSPIHCVLELPKLSLIMLQQESTNFVFSQEKNSVVHVDYIQSKQDVTSFTTIEDSTRAGIWEEKLSSNSYPFWNTTRMNL